MVVRTSSPTPARPPFVSLKHSWHTARKEAGLRDLRVHDLRHSFASFVINAGIDLYAVGKVLGHADHKSTMRYSHLANETLLAAFKVRSALTDCEFPPLSYPTIAHARPQPGVGTSHMN